MIALLGDGFDMSSDNIFLHTGTLPCRLSGVVPVRHKGH